MEISVSRRWLRRLAGGLLVPLVLTGLTLWGRTLTPRDAAGTPLLLSPSLRATLAYQEQARAWLAAFQGLDRELQALLAGQDDLYRQTEIVNDLLERALRLAQAIEVGRAPAALAGLRTLLAQTSLAFLEASRAAADWVGAPTPEREQAARAALENARDWLAQVAESRWLAEPGLSEERPGHTVPHVDKEEEEWWATATP
jgi:hypothetical protein